jgi:predicted nuclease of predicted toxin-antitoxin system
MLLLADESCDFAVVRALRAAGYQVAAVAEAARGAEDDAVLDLARRDHRILLTEDKDFGQLVYASARETGGVLLIRFPNEARQALPQAVVDTIGKLGEHLRGAFVVVEPGHVRVRRAP